MESKKIGIVLIGNSGVGKSTLGNLICQKNVFKESALKQSCTTDI